MSDVMALPLMSKPTATTHTSPKYLSGEQRAGDRMPCGRLLGHLFQLPLPHCFQDMSRLGLPRFGLAIVRCRSGSPNHSAFE
jgi:hypothetical protein